MRPSQRVSGTIERRVELSYEEFERDYLYTNRPVIVQGALREWKAVKRWTPAFFKEHYGDLRFRIPMREKGQAGYKDTGGVEFTMAAFIDEVMQSTEENPAPYFRNQILYDLFPSLKEDIQPLPSYFQPNWLPERYMVGRVREVLNRGAAIELYIGGKGGAFPVLHYDGVGTHAFLMQIFGRKKFIVFAPDQEPFLYGSKEKPNFSLINDPEHPDLARFPLMAQAKAITFVLEPGELLFVPSHWWHTTKMLTPSITLSINIANQSNWHELVRFVALRQQSRAVAVASRFYLTGAGAWRSWRDRSWSKRHPAPRRAA